MKRTIFLVKKSIKHVVAIDWRSVFALPNIAAVLITAAVISVALNSGGVMLKNYKLARQITELEQRVRVAQAEADKQRLQNQYFATDAFLDIAARRQLTKGAPGEKLIIVPKNVALLYASKQPALVEPVKNATNPATTPLSAWFNFLRGEGLPN